MELIQTIQILSPILEGLIQKVSTKLGTTVYFDKGHYLEIVKSLTQKEGAIPKVNKYPLFWLVLDMKETMFPRLGVYADVDVHFIIAKDTLINYSTQERIDNIFIPVLYPIYVAVMNEIQNCPSFFNSAIETLKHEKFDRYYWGGQDSLGNGEANLFNDFIDAIQVKALTISIRKNQNCKPSSI